jgi:hypothetical protein
MATAPSWSVYHLFGRPCVCRHALACVANSGILENRRRLGPIAQQIHTCTGIDGDAFNLTVGALALLLYSYAHDC